MTADRIARRLARSTTCRHGAPYGAPAAVVICPACEADELLEQLARIDQLERTLDLHDDTDTCPGCAAARLTAKDAR